MTYKGLILSRACLLSLLSVSAFVQPSYAVEVDVPPSGAQQSSLMRFERHQHTQGSTPSPQRASEPLGNAVVVVSAGGVSPAIDAPPAGKHLSPQVQSPQLQRSVTPSRHDLIHEATEKAAAANKAGVDAEERVSAAMEAPVAAMDPPVAQGAPKQNTERAAAHAAYHTLPKQAAETRREMREPHNARPARGVHKRWDRLTASKTVLPIDHVMRHSQVPVDNSSVNALKTLKAGSSSDELSTADTVMSVDNGLATERNRNRVGPDTHAEPSADPLSHSSAHEHQDSMRTTALHIPVPAHSTDPNPRDDKAAAQSKDEPGVLWLGEGVGSMTYDRSPSGSRKLNHVMRRRLEIQDVATVILLLVAFFATVFVSLLSVYSVSEDPSPILFYSDPKFFRQRLVCHYADIDSFLAAFNTQPQTARLRVVGRSGPTPTVGGLAGEMRLGAAWRLMMRKFCLWLMPDRRGRNTPWDPVIFDICLDLTPFITGNGELRTEADKETLEQHIQSANPMELLSLVKHVEWVCWEDVATNIRQRLRTLGFTGEVEVQYEATEEVLIYRNIPWQNFVRSKITQCLIILSILPALIWLPYLWCRSRRVRVESRFQITLDLARYWEHVSECLHATEGFQGAAVGASAGFR